MTVHRQARSARRFRSLGVLPAGAAVAAIVGVGVAASCTSPSIDDSSAFGGHASTSANTGGKASTGDTMSTMGTASTNPTMSTGTGFSDASGSTSTGLMGCASQSTMAQRLPLDIFIMLDQSGSMGDDVNGGTKWETVTAALKAFVSQAGLTDVSVGIQYFGLPPNPGMCGCSVDGDCGGGDFCDSGICFSCEIGDSCFASDYSKADVEIAPLPGVAQAIKDSIDQHGPTTSTPTLPALQGAIDHAKAWATAHPDHVVIDIFATDGDPSECDTDQSHIEAVAAAGFGGTPSIATFVIGVGSSLTALNGVAMAGGTGQAFIVDTSMDVTMQITAALDAIRGKALGCNYKIPAPMSGDPDYDKVNVVYTPGGGGTDQTIPRVQDKAHCPASGDGWYYDDPAAPTQILLCDSTCSKLSADSNGQVNVVLGCKTIVN